MKIALIIIAYIILGICTGLAFMIIEYKTNFKRYTAEEYYIYEVQDKEIIYFIICLFWPVVMFGMGIYLGITYSVKSLTHLMAYILKWRF